jgi:hypothetical protein
VYNAKEKAGVNAQSVVFSDQWYTTESELRSFAGWQPRHIPTYSVCTILCTPMFINLSIALMFGVMMAEADLPLALFQNHWLIFDSGPVTIKMTPPPSSVEVANGWSYFSTPSVPAQALSWCGLFDLIINTHNTGGGRIKTQFKFLLLYMYRVFLRDRQKT